VFGGVRPVSHSVTLLIIQRHPKSMQLFKTRPLKLYSSW